jgi:hypothetical protein
VAGKGQKRGRGEGEKGRGRREGRDGRKGEGSYLVRKPSDLQRAKNSKVNVTLPPDLVEIPRFNIRGNSEKNSWKKMRVE